MTIPQIIIIGALLLALIEEFGAQGRSLLGWSAVLICIALLYGQIVR